jgi:AraC-like DNA-binding protein
MDPLSDVLSLLKPRSYAAGGFSAGAEWSIQFGPHQGVKCYAVVSGDCWLSVEGVSEDVHLETGDCFLLPSGRPFRLASDMSLAPVDVLKIFPTPLKGGIAPFNDGTGFLLVGGHFALSRNDAVILLGLLPPIAHIRKESGKAMMRWSLERMMDELRDPQPGNFLIAQQLAYMMLVQALRLYMAEGAKGGVGWLFALADKQMSAAIHLMHGDPGYHWTLQTLAERTGMSRSVFANKFKQTVGASPMAYLTRWRILLAGDRLTTPGESVSVIARSLGYESESAFSTAFKRLMGCSPRQYSRSRKPALALGNVDEATPSDSLELVAG